MVGERCGWRRVSPSFISETFWLFLMPPSLGDQPRDWCVNRRKPAQDRCCTMPFPIKDSLLGSRRTHFVEIRYGGAGAVPGLQAI
jgi:hypothetical protein